ncbi:MAG: rhomboid family intramembrane serine protease [Gemmatimonadaceae bacterium]
MASPEMDRAQRAQALRDRIENGELNTPLSGPISTQSKFGAATRTFGGTLKRGAKVFAGILGTLGVVSVVNFLTANSLNRMFGLIPRTSSGAWGILFHPFLHANAAHLTMNAVGIVLIGGTVFLRSEKDFWRVTALGILIGGSATWLVGRTSVHIGASGVVFAYLGYLLTTGWFDRKLSSVALSIVAAALWGSALLGLSPVQSGISWELHLFGFVGGVVGAWWRKQFSQST